MLGKTTKLIKMLASKTKGAIEKDISKTIKAIR
jgi:hypothetical protein